MARELPKAPKPYRSVKGATNGGAKYVVRILDERAREGVLGGGGEFFWELKKVSQPTFSLGWYLPNNFEAEFNGLRVWFRVELFKTDRRPHWAIGSLTVETLKEGRPLVKLPRLPLEGFLKAAIHLATVECITYPPGYEGAVLNQSGEIVSGWEGWKVSVAPESVYGEQVPIGWIGSTPREVVQQFMASATDSSKVKKLNKKKRLELVARAWKQAPKQGKNEAVLRALVEAGDPVGRDRVKQLIREAREAGQIPASERSKK